VKPSHQHAFLGIQHEGLIVVERDLAFGADLKAPIMPDLRDSGQLRRVQPRPSAIIQHAGLAKFAS
jgi:hypothetical protein